LVCSRLFTDRVFGLTNYSRKSLGLFDREIGKHLAVEFDLSEVEAMYELRILYVIQTARCVNANDPQLTKITFLQLSAGIREV
jgi:hypothetical protein